jgi:hypothetical protein
MSASRATSRTGGEAGWYRIRIQGHLGQRWIAWFDGLILTRDGDGTTVLEGYVADQAALHGLLNKVRDMGLPLISVSHEGPTDPAHAAPHPSTPSEPRA